MRITNLSTSLQARLTVCLPGLVSLGLLFISTSATAQRNFDDVTIKTQEVTPNIHMLTGAGGNIGVSSGDDGIFIIDDQFAPLTDKIRAAISEIHDGPIRYVLNTHYHGDHTGGNENLGRSGSAIIAHDHVRARMQRGREVELFELDVQPSVPESLPVITFSDRLSLHLNGESVRVYSAPDAHTDGDSLIHFPASNVLHLGDLYFSTGYPFIDRDSGGSFVGLIKAIQFALSLTDEDTQIIPGHGPLAGQDDLQNYYDMLLAVRDAVQARIDRGMDLAATIADKPTAELDAEWGEYFINGDQITAIAWQSLALDHSKHHRHSH